MVDFIEKQRDRLHELCREHRVRRLEVFGSAAGDAFDADHSDLDFLVEFASIPPGEHSRAYFGLLRELEDLFGRKIDLVETAAITNPYFLRSVEGSRTVLYAA